MEPKFATKISASDPAIKILSHKYTIRKVKSLALSSSILTHYDFDQKLRAIREKGKNKTNFYRVELYSVKVKDR